MTLTILDPFCGTPPFKFADDLSLLFFFHHSFLPLGTIALVESKVDKIEGRKVFGSSELKSPDGKVTYVTANAIFIQVNPESYNKETGTKKE